MTLIASDKLDREAVLYVIGHEVLHRLMKIEPECLTLDYEGEGSIFTTTDEGTFLAGLLEMIDTMRSNKTN
jgi:hypothetical protein